MNVNGAWNYPKYWTDKPIPAIPGAVTTMGVVDSAGDQQVWMAAVRFQSDNGLPMMAWWVLDQYSFVPDESSMTSLLQREIAHIKTFNRCWS